MNNKTMYEPQRVEPFFIDYFPEPPTEEAPVSEATNPSAQEYNDELMGW